MISSTQQKLASTKIAIDADSVQLKGTLTIPAGAKGIVLFAHGSGSSRHSPRNNYVAKIIQNAGLGTLLFDLLTEGEETVDLRTRHLRFDIELLTRRLVGAAVWLADLPETAGLRFGFFGSSTGGAAALAAAAEIGEKVGAVVSRGGRPDLAGDILPDVKSPVLLIVGGYDSTVLRLNKKALAKLECEKELKIVSNATHLFEEHGALETVAGMAAEWFAKHLN